MTTPFLSLTTEQVPIDLLRPDPANPRRVSADELDALERSLRQFGFVQPVLARREDGIVIGGHQRLVVARRLGLTTVPVIWLDLPVEQSRLLGLALNRISGSWDEQLLARLLAELQATPDVDLTLSGFAEDEVKELLRSLEARERREQVEQFDLEAALEKATRAPRSKPWPSIGCCAVMRPKPRTSSASSADGALTSPSPTRPTTSTSAGTAASGAGLDAGRSPTTRSSRPRSRPSSAPGA